MDLQFFFELFILGLVTHPFTSRQKIFVSQKNVLLWNKDNCLILLSVFNGINLENSLTNVRIAMQSELENERTANYVGGNATVLLFMISGNVQNSQLAWEQARLLNETVPGNLYLLY